jgi:hypothetical protein
LAAPSSVLGGKNSKLRGIVLAMAHAAFFA